MAPRLAKIPHRGERASLQSIKDRNWVFQTDLHPSGKGTIAGMLRSLHLLPFAPGNLPALAERELPAANVFLGGPQ